jgi:hypothetical protein
MSIAMRQFNEVIGLFDFGLNRDQFLNRLRLDLSSSSPIESIVHCHAAVHYPFNGQYAQWTFLFAASTHFPDKTWPLLFNFVFYFLLFCFLC